MLLKGYSSSNRRRQIAGAASPSNSLTLVCGLRLEIVVIFRVTLLRCSMRQAMQMQLRCREVIGAGIGKSQLMVRKSNLRS